METRQASTLRLAVKDLQDHQDPVLTQENSPGLHNLKLAGMNLQEHQDPTLLGETLRASTLQLESMNLQEHQDPVQTQGNATNATGLNPVT
jgi:hypothetical protein